MAAKLSDLATGFRPEISCPYLISVYLYNPSNITKETPLFCLRLHVSTSGSHYNAFLRAYNLKLQRCSAHGIRVIVVECTWDPCYSGGVHMGSVL
jgi:hypothetical protein